MREDSAHARNHDLSAAAEIFANGTYFPNTLLTKIMKSTVLLPLDGVNLTMGLAPLNGGNSSIFPIYKATK
jgi:hypothetical protein